MYHQIIRVTVMQSQYITFQSVMYPCKCYHIIHMVENLRESIHLKVLLYLKIEQQNCNIQFYRYQSTYADIHADDYLVYECMQSLNNMFHIILLCKC